MRSAYGTATGCTLALRERQSPPFSWLLNGGDPSESAGVVGHRSATTRQATDTLLLGGSCSCGSRCR
jgi:hypothetical protein